MEKIGERIRRLREAAHVSQEQLAKYLNVDQSLIARIEKDERQLSTESIDKLADFFCVQAFDLLFEENVEPRMRIAFRASGVGEEDFQSIAAFNRIILNNKQMTYLAKGIKENEDK